MACNCKWCRWMPHNWFCLKGLYWIFITLFYLALVYTFYLVYAVSTAPLAAEEFWAYLIGMVLNQLGMMLGLLTVAAVLKALRKIVHAVAPCCCHQETKEEVVVVSSQDK